MQTYPTQEEWSQPQGDYSRQYLARVTEADPT